MVAHQLETEINNPGQKKLLQKLSSSYNQDFHENHSNCSECFFPHQVSPNCFSTWCLSLTEWKIHEKQIHDGCMLQKKTFRGGRWKMYVQVEKKLSFHAITQVRKEEGSVNHFQVFPFMQNCRELQWIEWWSGFPVYLNLWGAIGSVR